MAYEITYGQLVEGMMSTLNRQLIERNVIVIPGKKQDSVQTTPPQAACQTQTPQPPAPGNEGMGGEDIEAKINGGGFDAGVEADPDEDPKKYIQQLTGKLSTELQKYIDSGADQNGELSKYVLGMLVKQASKSLSEEDKKEIIKKINTTEQSEPSGTEPTEGEQEEAGVGEEPIDGQMTEGLLTSGDEGEKDRNDKKLRVSPKDATKRNHPFITKF